MTNEGLQTARVIVELAETEKKLANEILPILSFLGFDGTEIFLSLGTAQVAINQFLEEREVVQVENSLIEMVKNQAKPKSNNSNN